jgi:hypothetical protein
VTGAVAGVGGVPAPGTHWRLPLPLRRISALLALMAVPTALGLIARNADTRPLATMLSHYSPERFIHGRVWTLPLSGLVPPNLANLGPNTIAMTITLVPYVLLRGAWRTVGRFFAGHVLATLAVAALVLPGAAIGWRFASEVARAPDFGVSAGLAAIAGAMVVVVWRRRGRVAGVVVLVAVFGFFAWRLLVTGPLSHYLSESEHVVAALAGIGVEVAFA